MTDVPYDTTEIKHFTPASLLNVEKPPVFRLRAPTRRQRRQYDRLLIEEGLRSHSREDIRAEMLKGLEALWSPEDYALWQPQLRDYWEASDTWAEENEGKASDQAEPFVHELTLEQVSDLGRRINDNWPPLRKIAADNIAFARDAPAIMLAIVVSGWSTFDVPFQMHEGIIPLDTVDAISDKLRDLETEATGTATGLAYSELFVECSRRIFLTKDQEKNSSSGSPSRTTPQSMNAGQASRHGTSKELETSTGTPAT